MTQRWKRLQGFPSPGLEEPGPRGAQGSGHWGVRCKCLCQLEHRGKAWEEEAGRPAGKKHTTQEKWAAPNTGCWLRMYHHPALQNPVPFLPLLLTEQGSPSLYWRPALHLRFLQTELFDLFSSCLISSMSFPTKTWLWNGNGYIRICAATGTTVRRSSVGTQVFCFLQGMHFSEKLGINHQLSIQRGYLRSRTASQQGDAQPSWWAHSSLLLDACYQPHNPHPAVGTFLLLIPWHTSQSLLLILYY